MTIKQSYDFSKYHVFETLQCIFCKSNLTARRILMLPASICIELAGAAALMVNGNTGYADVQAEVGV